MAAPTTLADSASHQLQRSRGQLPLGCCAGPRGSHQGTAARDAQASCEGSPEIARICDVVKSLEGFMCSAVDVHSDNLHKPAGSHTWLLVPHPMWQRLLCSAMQSPMEPSCALQLKRKGQCHQLHGPRCWVPSTMLPVAAFQAFLEVQNCMHVRLTYGPPTPSSKPPPLWESCCLVQGGAAAAAVLRRLPAWSAAAPQPVLTAQQKAPVGRSCCRQKATTRSPLAAAPPGSCCRTRNGLPQLLGGPLALPCGTFANGLLLQVYGRCANGLASAMHGESARPAALQALPTAVGCAFTRSEA